MRLGRPPATGRPIQDLERSGLLDSLRIWLEKEVIDLQRWNTRGCD